uniref:Putative prolyl 4-hydroxylase subunit alpha-2 n=1 Tax=Anopheles darlingi TaxID=43151 RepID=A0A2M4DKV4_ANODA
MMSQVSAATLSNVVVLITLWLCCSHPSHTVNGEYYSSVEQMKQLLKLEESLIGSLDQYIKLHEQKIEFLHRQRKILTNELKHGQKDELGYVSNPITAFLLTNRLVSDWERIRNFLDMDVGAKLTNSSAMPTSEDLTGVAEGIARLQELYQLSAKEMADGKILDRELHRSLTPGECYLIGTRLSAANEYKFATSWLREALRRWTTENPGVSKVEILNALSYSLSQQFKYAEALEFNRQALKLQPDNTLALKSKEPLEQWIEYERQHGLPPVPNTPADWSKFYSLCRGESPRTASEMAKLRCRYVSNRVPFLKIAPLKLEEVSLDPFIVVYHQVISDNEIKTIIEISRNSLKRSRVGDSKKQEVTKARTSSNAWLDDPMHPHVRSLSRRTEHMTGLTMWAAEQLQVGNYGIGGHYLPHFDYGTPEEGEELYPNIEKGNRIATVMHYVSKTNTLHPDLAIFLLRFSICAFSCLTWKLEVLQPSPRSVLPCSHGKDQPFFGTICTGTEQLIHELYMARVRLCSALNGV